MKTDLTLFIDFLCSQGLIERDGIDNALSHLEGIDGIVAVGDYILGYEGLARTITEKSSFERLKRFMVKNQSMLSADPERRYYFVQSLLENPVPKRQYFQH
ncbi:MAG: hypothetical protein ABJK59_11065 [Erythrobacter sp.]|uniref:hypothetical protein n=1 Tax=Erythrobacter sp. TaxID=1042 RepID=UPI00329793D2